MNGLHVYGEGDHLRMKQDVSDTVAEITKRVTRAVDDGAAQEVIAYLEKHGYLAAHDRRVSAEALRTAAQFLPDETEGVARVYSLAPVNLAGCEHVNHEGEAYALRRFFHWYAAEKRKWQAEAWYEGYDRGFYDRELLHGEVRDAHAAEGGAHHDPRR